MDAVQRRGSAARMNYIKRFGSVLLAFALCLGMMQPPKAKAVVAEATLAVGGALGVSAGAAVGGVLLSMLIAAVGVDFVQGYIEVGDKGVFGTGAYEMGYQLRSALEDAGGALWEWYSGEEAAIIAAGGYTPGMEINVPAGVAEFTRQWVKQNYDFSSGDIKVNQSGILCGDSFILFTSPYPFSNPNVYGATSIPPNISLGTLLPLESTVTFGDKQYFFGAVTSNNYGWYYLNSDGSKKGFLVGGYGSKPSVYGTLLYLNGKIVFGDVTSEIIGCCAPTYRVDTDALILECSLTGTGALDVPKDRDIGILVPDVPMAKVRDMRIPALRELTGEDVLTGVLNPPIPTTAPVDPPMPTTAPIDPPITDTDAMVGDATIDQIKQATEDKSLSALFISKFPFCIPWDVVNAVKLLAAPAKTPHWEVDFMAPIAHRYGGSLGDTNIVIDFGEFEFLGQLCRWTTTLLFVAFLAMGTKRLIWTA